MSAAVEAERPAGRSRLTGWLIGVGVVTFLAGLLFGYDQGVISGALPLLQDDLGLSTIESEIITSWVTLGALFGALVAGWMADRLGRRWTAVAAGLLFAGGALVETVAPGRRAADPRPRHRRLRGRARLRRRSALRGGDVAQGAARAVRLDVPAGDHGRHLPRLPRRRRAHELRPLAAHVRARGHTRRAPRRRLPRYAGVGALAPEGGEARRRPRLAHEDRRPEAAPEQLATIEGELTVEAREGTATWGEVFSPLLRRALIVGVGLAIFQQVTGINAIIYYANEIFAEAGFTTAEEQAKATLYAVGLVNVLATFVAVAWVDHFGRKPLLFTGLVGMGVSLTAVGIAFAVLDTSAASATSTTTAGIVTVVALVVFIASFAFSMGPVVWTLISEIYPNRVRGRAVAVATAVNWGAAFLVTQFFLSLVAAIGESTTFFLFALLCVAALAFVWRLVPETKGRSLEEIQADWKAAA